MRVLFIELEMEREWSLASIGPAFLAAFVRKHGHDVLLHRSAYDESLEKTLAVVQSIQPDILALSLTTRQWLRARAVVKTIRQAINIPTIAGGLHPTFSPESTLGKFGFDYICLGEGETAFLDFLNIMEQKGYISPDEIPNIWVKGASRPSVRSPISSLNDLPFMARDMLREKHGVASMTTQRGCPFPCTYCAARMYNEMYGTTQYGRRRSINNVLAELQHLRQTGPLNYIIFQDDTFTIQPKWLREFLPQYKKEIHIPFSINARAETISPKMLDQLVDAGCKHIIYGVESGSERLRTDIMKRNVSNKHLYDVFRWSKERGVITTANYMLGMPTETPAEIEETLALHHQLQPHDFGYFVFYPYPGTPMYHYCKKHGYLPEDFEDIQANHRSSVLVNNTLTDEDIEEYYQRFTHIRKQGFLKQYGQYIDEAGRKELHRQIEYIAETG